MHKLDSPMPKPKKKAQTPLGKSLVNFDNPPINEVVCGVGFRSLGRLFSPYLGRWWSEILKDFPNVKMADPIIGPTEQSAFPILERTMLVSKDESQMIQLQPSRFYYNWVRARDDQIYPRFSKVYSTFDGWFSKFEKFIRRNNIGEIDPTEYTLTYVNYIPEGDGWNVLADVHRVLPDISWRKSRKRRYISEPADIHFRYIFPIHEQPGRVTATIQRGVRRSDQVSILRLELAAQAAKADGLPGHNAESMSEWFEAAREAIVLGFVDLTDESVQVKYWGRRD